MRRIRRQTIDIGYAVAFLIAATVGCGGGETPVSDPAPVPGTVVEPREPEDLNIILITIDTLRSDRVSSYGSEQVNTPNIDGFAREGVLFSNAASTVPFTLPAHASILSGLYPPGHGVRENVGYTVGEEVTTIAEVLSEHGWSTAGFVSAFVLDSRWGIAQGFDRFFDEFDLSSFEKTPNLSSVQRTGDVTIAETVRWLDERPEETPFFVWLHLYDPHDPYTPPEPYASLHPNRPYEGEVAYTDSLIGDFRRSLEERGLLDDTLIILTADHGEGLGDHGEASHGFFLYDTTIHVPLIIRQPTASVVGRTVDTAVSHVDLFPTILDAVGIDPPRPVHGRSLRPFLDGGDPEWDREVYSESLYPLLHYGWAPLRAARTDNHKLISAPRPELFDLRTDGREEHDLAAEQPLVVADLERRLTDLRSWIDHDSPSTTGTSPDLDPQTLAQLQALGYAAGQGGVSLEEEEDRPRADPKDRIGIHRTIMRAQTQIRTDQAAAKRALLNVVDRDPGVLDAHQMLGQIAVLDSQYEDALGHYRRALELEPEHRNSLQGMAAAYRALGREEEALVGYRRLLDIAGADTGATLAIADIEFKRGRMDEAVAALEEAVETSDAPALIRNKMGEVRAEQGRAPEAFTLFERAIEESSAFATPYFNLAVLHEERGEVREAIGRYEKAIELAPNYYYAQFNLGRLLGQLGQVERQQELWEASIESNPDFVQGYFYLSKLVMDRGQDLARAEELVRMGLSKDPEHHGGPLGYFVLADILNRTGRPAEAREAVAAGKRVQAEMS